MKFILFVEGYTEAAVLPAFLKRWLDPRLKQPVGIDAVRFDGWPEMVRDSPQRVKAFLNAPKGDVIAVIALLDLYGLQLPYPASVNSVAKRIAWATTYLEQRVGETRFRQFFAVHETEAWLLSQPMLFPAEIAKGLQSKTSKPETVNFDEPPASLLNRLYKSATGHDYKKVTQAKNLFPALDPEAAYAKCPQLKALLDTLLELAQDAGH